jgi:dephospho-CoA kinase
MLTIGITGGIGSGKSTVCKVFNVLGIPVFQADAVAARLQNEDPQIVDQMITIFGADVYLPGGILNRKMLASIIFSDDLLLEKVNGIIHPAVHEAFRRWKSNFSGCPYLLYEAAILFETGSFRSFDKSILVVAKEEERIARVLKREQTSEEAIRKRISHQMSDQEKMKMADYVIYNNDNEMIIPQILTLDKILKS